jgi:predicted acyltransferase
MSSQSNPPVPPLAQNPDFLKQRLVSLDAYRGLIMVALAFEGFGLAATAKKHIDANINPDFWDPILYQFDHVQWVGCAFWDLIQPSFMFMVGVAAAYSYAKRAASGQSQLRLFLHVCLRSLILVFLGIFLISNNRPTTEWSLMNVLTQIGLGYPFLYLLWRRSFRTQALAAAVILVGTYLLYVTYPYSGVNIETGAPEVGITAKWAKENLTDVGPPWHKEVPPAWHKNANVGQAIDLWLLNRLPLHGTTGNSYQQMGVVLMQNNPLGAAAVTHYYETGGREQFRYNPGGYQTINFLPSLATMLFGLMCGQLLRSSRSPAAKLRILFAAGLMGLLIGQVLNATAVCPLVKRIWTPSWALFSTGWCCVILGSLYGVVDVLGYRRWTWPLVVVGVNSIAIYCMGMTMKRWTANTLKTHLGANLFQPEGWELYEPMLRSTAVGLVFWLVCWWMYRNKIFIRI